MNVTVEFHGVLRQLIGCAEIELTLAPGASVADARTHVLESYPDVAQRLSASASAIGDSLVQIDTLLADGARLALIPPVSGG